MWASSKHGASPLHIQSERLVRFAGFPASRIDCGLFVFDCEGRPVARYDHAPWTAHALEWDEAAFEIQPDEGTIVSYERYATRIDLHRLAPDLRGRLEQLART